MRLLLVQYQILKGTDVLWKLPSLALASIAGNLDKSLCDVKILEMFSEGLGGIKDSENLHIPNSKPRTYFFEQLKLYNPDMVGLTCKTFEYHTTLELAKLVKTFNPDIKVILGGYHATIASQIILSTPDAQYFDYLVTGEGELVFNNLIRSFHDGTGPANVENIAYRKNGSVVHHPRAPLLNVKDIRLPNRGARSGAERYHVMGIPCDTVETSRGCVFDCSFCCMQSMYGKSFRRFPVERVIEDIKDARKYGAKGIIFVDDNITINYEHFNELCDAIIASGLHNMKYGLQASVKGLRDHPEIIPKMKTAGIKAVVLGIESSHDHELDFMQKSNQFREKDVYTVVENLKKSGILVFGAMIVGTPDESETSIEKKYRFLKRLGVDSAYFSILTPFPGTKIREELEMEHLITNHDDFSRYTLWHANIRTMHLSSDRLFELTRRIERRFFRDPRILAKAAMFAPKFLPTALRLVWRK